MLKIANSFKQKPSEIDIKHIINIKIILDNQQTLTLILKHPEIYLGQVIALIYLKGIKDNLLLLHQEVGLIFSLGKPIDLLKIKWMLVLRMKHYKLDKYIINNLIKNKNSHYIRKKYLISLKKLKQRE